MAKGYVNLLKKEGQQDFYGFVRDEAEEKSYFLSPAQIKHFSLVEFDRVECMVEEDNSGVGKEPRVVKILSINGEPPEAYEDVKPFKNFKAMYPEKRITLGKTPSLREVELFTPFGRGQRMMIVAPPKAGKTTLIRGISKEAAKDKELDVRVLLIDERPEEVSEFEEIKGISVFASTFDESHKRQCKIAEAVIEGAKRDAARGKDVVIILDSLTRLTRAYNNVISSGGKVMSGGLDPMAVTAAKAIFGAARNLKGAGSLTIVATILSETNSRLDDVIREEFRGTGNSDLFLSRELADKKIFPAIDLVRSSTRREEMLIRSSWIDAATYMKNNFSTEEIIKFMNETTSNEMLAKRIELIKK